MKSILSYALFRGFSKYLSLIENVTFALEAFSCLHLREDIYWYKIGQFSEDVNSIQYMGV